MRIWLDDIRPAPEGYTLVHSVNETKSLIDFCEHNGRLIKELNLDHDLGDYAKFGGDGIKLVLWLAETKRYYPIKFHTQNIVGRENMQAIVDRYWP